MRNLTVSLFCFMLAGCGNGLNEISLTGVCDGYGDPMTSAYKVPYAVGTSHEIAQGNCGPASHNGNDKYAYDFIMPIGTAVIAARAGTVYKVVQDKNDGNGCASGDNHVYIQHSDGTMARYVHLTHNGSLVSEGDSITQGQTIASSGNTGCSGGPHLHFQVDSDISSQISIPVTFSNVGENPRGLITGKTYTAQ
jgi:murein DD-endopeptidase MepM/ murein hydrolase activator NlpD